MWIQSIRYGRSSRRALQLDRNHLLVQQALSSLATLGAPAMETGGAHPTEIRDHLLIQQEVSTPLRSGTTCWKNRRCDRLARLLIQQGRDTRAPANPAGGVAVVRVYQNRRNPL